MPMPGLPALLNASLTVATVSFSVYISSGDDGRTSMPLTIVCVPGQSV